MNNEMFAIVAQRDFDDPVQNSALTNMQNLNELDHDFTLDQLQNLPLDQYLKSLENQIDQLQELFLAKLFNVVELNKISLNSKLTISLDADGSITVNGEQAICELFNQELSSSIRQIAVKLLLAKALEHCQTANQLSNLSTNSHETIFKLCLQGNLAHSFLVE